MAIATIQEAVDRGYISTYLAANDNSKGALFGPRKAAPGSPVSIQLISNALDWGNSGGAQTAQDLREMANYLVWLCGIYGQQAQAIIEGGGGGSVVPGGGGSGTLPFPYDWLVSGSASPVAPLSNGDSSVTLTTFIGFNVEFTRGGITQNTTDLGDGSSFYSWNRVTGLFSISPSAATGELFRIVPIG